MGAVPVPLATQNFPQFGSQHLVILVVTLVGCVVAFRLGRRWRGRREEQWAARVLGTLVLGVAVPQQVAELVGSGRLFYTSLPFQLSDLVWMVAVWTLFTGGRRSRSLLYYWGLTLTPQAVITPSLGHLWPEPLFITFWAVHVLTLWAAVFVCLGVGPGPDWRDYRWALLCTALWAVLVMGFNALAGTNYGFLNAKPPSASALDLLGPWPVYVFAEVAILVAVWALMTWPWTAGRRRRRAAQLPT